MKGDQAISQSTFQDFGAPLFIVSPLHLGWANCWKLNTGLAIEANVNGGYSVAPLFNNPEHGFEISPEVKLRLERAVFGLGYVYSSYVSRSSGYYKKTQMHGVRLTVGIVK